MDGWSHVGLLDDIDMSSGLFYVGMIYGGVFGNTVSFTNRDA